MKNSVRSGSCLCGAVKFEVEGEASSVAHCHCRMCQKFSGAPVVTWATFRSEQVRFTGAVTQRFRSSNKAWRGFCGGCGASVFWQSALQAGYMDLCVALFDDPASLPPTYAIWTSAKLSWLSVDEHLPQHPERGPDQD